MPLFGGKRETKEEKEQREIQRFLERFHLSDMDERDLEMIREINSELAGTGLMQAGMTLSLGGKTEDRLTVYYLGAIMKQNWIIIRKLHEIAKAVQHQEQ